MAADLGVSKAVLKELARVCWVVVLYGDASLWKSSDGARTIHARGHDGARPPAGVEREVHVNAGANRKGVGDVRKVRQERRGRCRWLVRRGW